jgi:phosphoribosyl-ATP pyrophosphohydrolase/phosphoribosyl-AMP cyclohydrolase
MLGSPNNVSFDERGLVPVVVQDATTGEVLMLAYMNAESLARTIKTGETWFWSRSRQLLWHKGETSGNTQEVESITVDCDGDTLLVKVHPRGPACHTGEPSCFFKPFQ